MNFLLLPCANKYMMMMMMMITVIVCKQSVGELANNEAADGANVTDIPH